MRAPQLHRSARRVLARNSVGGLPSRSGKPLSLSVAALLIGAPATVLAQPIAQDTDPAPDVTAGQPEPTAPGPTAPASTSAAVLPAALPVQSPPTAAPTPDEEPDGPRHHDQPRRGRGAEGDARGLRVESLTLGAYFQPALVIQDNTEFNSDDEDGFQFRNARLTGRGPIPLDDLLASSFEFNFDVATGVFLVKNVYPILI